MVVRGDMSLSEEDKQWIADTICGAISESESRLTARIAETAQAVEDRTTGRIDGSESRLTILIAETSQAVEERTTAFVGATERRLASHIAETAQGVEDRNASLVAAEMGSLHTDIQQIDRRLKRVDGNTITTMELLTRQSRWHEESDNELRTLTRRQSEFAHKLEDLRERIEKLEHPPH
jgi:chromosome segregation ATPase